GMAGLVRTGFGVQYAARGLAVHGQQGLEAADLRVVGHAERRPVRADAQRLAADAALTHIEAIPRREGTAGQVRAGDVYRERGSQDLCRLLRLAGLAEQRLEVGSDLGVGLAVQAGAQVRV